MKKAQYPTGKFDLTKGFEIVRLQQMSQDETRYFNALEKVLRELIGLEKSAVGGVSLPPLSNPPLMDDLDKFLRHQDYSSGYRANLKNKLHEVLKVSPKIEDFSYIREGWKSFLKDAVPTLNENLFCLTHWYDYVELKKIWPVSEVSSATLLDFQNFLTIDRSLTRFGGAQTNRDQIRDVLIAASLFEKHRVERVEFGTKLLSQLDKLETFAVNGHITEDQKQSLRIAEYGGNTKVIERRTIEKNRRTVKAWVKFEISRGKLVDEITLETFLNIDFQTDYLDFMKREKYSLSSAESNLDIAKSLARLAFESKAVDFDLEAFKGSVNKRYEILKNHFSRKDVRKHEKYREGGVPDTKELHSFFCKKLEKERPKWQAVFRLLLKSKNQQPDNVHNLFAETAVEVRGAVFAALTLFLSPRMGDVTLLDRDNLRFLNEELINVSFIPTKTKNTRAQPVVDMCLPPWITGLIADYLLIVKFMNVTSTKLFPPLIRSGQAQVDEKKKLSYSQFVTLTTKWLRTELSANDMRTILSNLYLSCGVDSLYLAMGHALDRTSQGDRGGLTTLESRNYLSLTDNIRIKKALASYDLIADGLSFDKKFDSHFLSKDVRQLLKIQQKSG